MAIRIFEMCDMGNDGNAPIRRAPWSVSQSGTVGVSTVQSNAFKGSTRIVTIQTDEACHLVFGADPTAVTTGYKLAAGETEDFGVEPNSKVAWIAAA